METEQNQKKILFAGLTILVLAGIFLYSASFIDRNVSVIQTVEPAASILDVASEEVVPIAKPILSWANYWNREYGYEVMYPANWTTPWETIIDNEVPTIHIWPGGFGEGCCQGIRIQVQTGTAETAFKKLVKDYPKEDLFSDTSKTLAGVQVRELVFDTHYGDAERVTIVPLKGKYLLLRRGASDEAVGEKIAESFNFVRIDSAGRRTYRNEEYGFELKYPKVWSVKESITAGVGLPIDCEQTPEECRNTVITFSEPKETNGSAPLVALQISPKREEVDVESGGGSSESLSGWTDWDKQSPTGLRFSKSSIFFPIYGACYMVVGVPTVKLKRDVNYSFEVMYEIPGDVAYDDAEDFCKVEHPDPVLDAIVGSLKTI